MATQWTTSDAWWRAFALALLWAVCASPLLLGLMYGLTAMLFDLGR